MFPIRVGVFTGKKRNEAQFKHMPPLDRRRHQS